MNYIYEKILNEGETAIFDKKDLQLFEEYVTKNYKEFYENKSREVIDAVNAQLMRESNSAMPISNSSRTKVTRGRAASFDD